MNVFTGDMNHRRENKVEKGETIDKPTESIVCETHRNTINELSGDMKT